MMKRIIFLVFTSLLLGCEKQEPFSDSAITYKVYAAPTIHPDEPVVILIYPNPFTDMVIIDVIVRLESRISLTLTNQGGDLQKVLDDFQIDAGRMLNVKVNFANHQPGIYLCEVVVNDKVDRFELIKAR